MKASDMEKVQQWADGHIARIQAEMQQPGVPPPQYAFFENQLKEWRQFKEGKRPMVV